MHTRRPKLALFALLIAALGMFGPPAGAAPASDDFDRADGPLGANWTVEAGNFAISGNQAFGDTGGLATYNGATGLSASVDLAYGGTQTAYAGVVLDYLDVANNLFIKLQNNGGGPGLDRVYCYRGNNGGGGTWDTTSFPLSVEATSATLTATLDPTTRDVTVVVSAINGGAGVETFTCPNAPVTGGTGVGIVGYAGLTSIDNFVAGGEDVTPPTVTCDPDQAFTVGETGEVTATVTDTESGPANETASAPADTETAGDKVVEVTGADNAGNEATAECAYTVVEEDTPDPVEPDPVTPDPATEPDATQAPQTTPATPAAQPTTAQPSFTG